VRGFRLLLGILLVALLGANEPGRAAPLPGWAIPIKGLGKLALYGATPEKAVHNYVEGVIRRGVFPGREAQLRAWGRTLAMQGAQRLEDALVTGKPVSGIQLNHIDDLIGESKHQVARKAYATALGRTGVQSIFFAPGESGRTDRVVQRLGAVHHLHLTGGDDLHPELWGGKVTYAKPHELNLIRDRLEQKTVRKAMAMGLPIDATCRGYQLMNVTLGGTMVQDIIKDKLSTHVHFGPGFTPIPHPVFIEPDSAVARTVGSYLASVPSMHHQALGRIGWGLRVVGRAPDGVTEMVEGLGGWWRGNQFHAELTRSSWSLAMYRDMAARAYARMNGVSASDWQRLNAGAAVATGSTK
jgi:putative glutamine amidotransferase